MTWTQLTQGRGRSNHIKLLFNIWQKNKQELIKIIGDEDKEREGWYMPLVEKHYKNKQNDWGFIKCHHPKVLGEETGRSLQGIWGFWKNSPVNLFVNQRSNCQHLLDHWKSKRDPEKHLLLLYQLCQRLWLCGSWQTVENSSNLFKKILSRFFCKFFFRPPELPSEKSVCRLRSNN